MKVVEEKDGAILMVSDGTPIENNTISALVEILSKYGLPDEEFNDSFGCGIDDGVYKNYIYLPDISFVRIDENDN